MRFCYLLIAAVLLAAVAAPATADPRFYVVFKKEYLEKHPDKEFAKAMDKADVRCLVCHQGKKSKKHRNAFGDAMDPLLDRKKDLKNDVKISAALKKALAAKVDPKNDKSETFLDRLKASKWPAGELEDLKKEPTEEEKK
jgi:cytochrome c2